MDASDLLDAARFCSDALGAKVSADWSVPAGDLEWSCRQTLEHIVEVPLFYARHLAARATERIPHALMADAAVPVADLLASVLPMAAVLARVVEATPPDVRAFHPAAMADRTGFVAMGCDEILVHAFDIGRGLGAVVEPDRGLCRRIVDRLFPWAPSDGDAWTALLWANGRTDLAERARLGPEWVWHCAPLEEWDGTIPTWQG